MGPPAPFAARPKPIEQESTDMRDQSLWTWHLAAGAVILVLLGLHMVNMHLEAIFHVLNPAGGHPTDWANVVARARHAAFMVIYILLLGSALYHGFYGLRNILFELNPGAGLRTAITGVLVVGGIGLFVLGTWAAIEGFQHAQIAQAFSASPAARAFAPWLLIGRRGNA